jgi:hypothetical protein
VPACRTLAQSSWLVTGVTDLVSAAGLAWPGFNQLCRRLLRCWPLTVPRTGDAWRQLGAVGHPRLRRDRGRRPTSTSKPECRRDRTQAAWFNDARGCIAQVTRRAHGWPAHS